ncbi:MAG TPA: hypothetical protein VH480_19840 [Streptosporangiaceae bacterium]
MDIQLYGSYTTRRYRAATRGEIERMLSAPPAGSPHLPARPRNRRFHRAR